VFIEDLYCGTCGTITGTSVDIVCNDPDSKGDKGLIGNKIEIRNNNGGVNLSFTNIKVFGYQLESLKKFNVPMKSVAIDVDDSGVPFIVTDYGYIFYTQPDGIWWK
jgi:hypothetical protein